MKEIIDRFVGLDPILGDQAKDELIALGEKSLHEVIARFGDLNRTSHLQMRLGQLFGHFGDRSVDPLLAVLSTANWHMMVDATYCFANLPEQLAGNGLIKNLDSGNIDIIRCSIDALGYLGAKTWMYKVIGLFDYATNYQWEKLGHNAYPAVFRILTRQNTTEDVLSCLDNIEDFYKIAGDSRFGYLWSDNWPSMDLIFSSFRPVAADAITNRWLDHENPFFLELAAKALGGMRLNRAVGALHERAIKHIKNNTLLKVITYALAQIESKSAAEAIQDIFSRIDRPNPVYGDVCQCLAICLYQLKDRQFVEDIYPQLLEMGGETAAYTYYSLGLLGFEKDIWAHAVSSADYFIRASIAPVYAHLKVDGVVSKLLQMEKESSDNIERALILSSLINAGATEKYNELRNILALLTAGPDLRMLRNTWKREIILALKSVEEEKNMPVWEKLFRMDARTAIEEVLPTAKGITFSLNNVAPAATNCPLVNIFVSYAHKDKKIKNLLVDTYLKAIQIHYGTTLVAWTDAAIKPGVDWDNTIKKAIDNANIILFLITNNFLASDYIQRTEIERAVQRFKKRLQIIVPVYIEEVSKKLLPFADRQYTPEGKPLKSWKPQNQGWVKIQESIIDMIDDINLGNTADYFD